MPELSVMDGVLAPRELAAVVELSKRFPAYRPSSYRPRPTRNARRARPNAAQRRFGPRLAGRLDAARNFVRTGGRLGRAAEDPAMLAARTDYFRGTYAVNGIAKSPVARMLLTHVRLQEAARELHGRPIVVPFVVYANLLVPGQELGVHTDVPAFRGVHARDFPPWLLVVMRHSGLFEDRRLPVATLVLYFGEAAGGEFAYYPDGPGSAAATISPRHNSAVAIDGDSMFHGVDRVHGDDAPLRELRSHMRLVYEDGEWVLGDSDHRLARYGAGDVRFSLSWKAHCFSGSEQRRAASSGRPELSPDAAVQTLLADLRARERLPANSKGLSNLALAHLLIDEFVPFPSAVE